MAGDTREQLTAGISERLPEVIRTALGEPGAMPGQWTVMPLHGGFGSLARGSQPYALSGLARVGGAARPWRVVLKTFAPLASQDDPTQVYYWKRESRLYGSSILDSLSAGLRAPRCYGCDERADGTVWLWLEQIKQEEGPWPIARWALAARHLGQFNGAFLAGRPLPRAPWLGSRRLRSWLDRHVLLVARIAAAADDPALRHWWPRPTVEKILRLWEEKDSFCDALERLPQAFCHGDAIRRNLLSRRTAGGAEETVGIDWEFAGYAAAGEEIGQTLSVASAFYDLDPADLPVLDEALFDAYLTGLRETGWSGDPRLVRLAYATHAALRNLFNAVGTAVPDDAQRTATLQSQGRTWEELADRRAAIRPFLLQRAAEARTLADTHG